MYLVYKLNSDPNECLDRENVTESPTDDDFQPAKKRFRTPGQQVWNYLKINSNLLMIPLACEASK